MAEALSRTTAKSAKERRAAILEFWFAGKDTPRDAWFEKDPAFDAEITARFMEDYERARAGDYDSWQDNPKDCLALVLLLDQFPRNMFRDDPRAFATDAKALNVAQHAIAQGFDRAVSPVARLFFYLPFQHSEDKLMQDRSLELHRALPDWDQPGSPFAFAQRHWEIIRRFGRFPHRNAVLGRESTVAESEFLKQPNAGF
jgi:uncharacterized protein (DUF924 family)